MAVREAVFNIYSDAGGNMPEDRAGFNDNVTAFCILNGVFLAFTVVKFEPLLWGKTRYILSVKLVNYKTGRACGNKEFDNEADAINYGRDFLIRWFPEVDMSLYANEQPVNAELPAK